MKESNVPYGYYYVITDDEVTSMVKAEDHEMTGEYAPDFAALDDAFRDEWGCAHEDSDHDAMFDIVAVPDDVVVDHAADRYGAPPCNGYCHDCQLERIAECRR